MSAVLAEAGAPIPRMLYVNQLVHALQRTGFRPVWLDDAPVGSVVAVYAQDRRYPMPLHYGILAGRRGDGVEMYESGYPAGQVNVPHVLQKAFHDGKEWARTPSRTYFLAPPDTMTVFGPRNEMPAHQ